MTIASTLESYLHDHHIPFQSVVHPHSSSSISTAISANVPLQNIAKAVVLKDHEGRRLLAVLPASFKISLSALNDELLATYRLAREQEVYKMFSDCEHGAIPALGAAYNMNTVCEQVLDDMEHVYIEAGDHQTLIKIDKAHFQDLMKDSKHLHFSRQVIH
ncbi:YbaK/EbsC family protein [Thalassotalea mangrovi]|uniref:YbaK/EbsC family protein n=1 Tax=Thalassotalea mangrovi TaxID=2572245 RepID=A0A4U1B9Q9_9GAMM|nr:YbaK/EbsC family protein [Thalassotalea mangrovi]TKB47451.1 YbaK/EbsC family protein [Thalassotalea mangrovi]